MLILNGNFSLNYKNYKNKKGFAPFSRRFLRKKSRLCLWAYVHIGMWRPHLRHCQVDGSLPAPVAL